MLAVNTNAALTTSVAARLTAALELEVGLFFKFDSFYSILLVGAP